MGTYRSERGQSIALIVVALAVLFGFAGLAVDGGRVFSEQRRAQNAADAAAYAAGMASVEGNDPYQAGLDQASLNGFLDTDRSFNADQLVDVVVNNPPTEGQYVGNSEYFEVIIRTKVGGTFSRIVNIDELPVEAYAVVHALGIDNYGGENAVHGLDREGIAVEFQGNIVVDVEGGNITANGKIDKDGYSGDIHVCDEFVDGAPPECDDPGHIYYVKGSADDWLGDVQPDPEKIPNPMEYDDVPTPDCGTVEYQHEEDGYDMVNGWKVYQPGIYFEEIHINAHDQVRFEPGMFCLWEGIKDNGNAITVGSDVMFVLLGGDLLFNGRSTTMLIRPDDLIDPSDNQWGGMLVYVSPDNKKAVVEITGNNGTQYAGTIYAPEGECNVGGEAELMGLQSNIVCHRVLFHGNPEVYIRYNAAQNWRPPPMIELSE